MYIDKHMLSSPKSSIRWPKAEKLLQTIKTMEKVFWRLNEPVECFAEQATPF